MLTYVLAIEHLRILPGVGAVLSLYLTESAVDPLVTSVVLFRSMLRRSGELIAHCSTSALIDFL